MKKNKPILEKKKKMDFYECFSVLEKKNLPFSDWNDSVLFIDVLLSSGYVGS